MGTSPGALLFHRESTPIPRCRGPGAQALVDIWAHHTPLYISVHPAPTHLTPYFSSLSSCDTASRFRAFDDFIDYLLPLCEQTNDFGNNPACLKWSNNPTRLNNPSPLRKAASSTIEEQSRGQG